MQQFGFKQGEFLASGQRRMKDSNKDKMAALKITMSGPDVQDFTVITGWTCSVVYAFTGVFGVDISVFMCDK